MPINSITLADGSIIEVTLSSSTAAPDAPIGTICGRAFSTWYRVNQGAWIGVGLGLWVEMAVDMANNSKNLMEFENKLKIVRDGPDV